jgi:hypothetical protein
VLNAAGDGRWRAIGRIETDDLLAPWPHGEARLPERKSTYTATCNIAPVFMADHQDPPEVDFYQAAAIKYPYADDAWLMFPTAYRHTPPPVGTDGNDGPLATQFACSRDGLHWQRPDREPYLRPGLDDEFDRGYNMMGVGLARFGNYLYQYYMAKGSTHHGPVDDLPKTEREKLGNQCFVAVRQRLDGFVSADAAYTGGWLRTPPLRFSGSRLELNLDCEATGVARVALTEADGRPIPGYGLDDCEAIGGNHIARTVTWGGKADLTALRDRPVCLHFALRSTKQYAFQFAGD